MVDVVGSIKGIIVTQPVDGCHHCNGAQGAQHNIHQASPATCTVEQGNKGLYVHALITTVLHPIPHLLVQFRWLASPAHVQLM